MKPYQITEDKNWKSFESLETSNQLPKECTDTMNQKGFESRENPTSNSTLQIGKNVPKLLIKNTDKPQNYQLHEMTWDNSLEMCLRRWLHYEDMIARSDETETRKESISGSTELENLERKTGKKLV